VHAYDGNTYDRVGDRFYYKPPNGNGGGPVFEYNPISATWQTITPPNDGLYHQCCSGTAFVPNWGLLIYNNNTGGTPPGYVYRYDPSTLVWSSMPVDSVPSVPSLN